MNKEINSEAGSNLKIRLLKDKLFSIFVMIFAFITISPIVLIIYKLVAKGYKQINLSFFTEVAPDTYEAMVAIGAGETIPGGILNGLTGTLYMVGIAALLAIPVG